MPSILWRGRTLQSAEHAEVAEIPGGHRLAGIVIAVSEARPIHLVYQVDVDEGWRTRIARVTVFADGTPSTLALGADGDGRWTVDGEPAPELEGCLDVDLRWTPVTNTLPIRRLGVGPGERASVTAVWIGFPDLTIERLDQTYANLGDGRWRYTAGDFEADLLVDPDGLVLNYGDEWRAIAHSDPDRLPGA